MGEDVFYMKGKTIIISISRTSQQGLVVVVDT